MNKWKSIRDSFTRSLRKQAESQKSGSGKKKVASYLYGDQLRFLRSTKDMYETQDSLQSETESMDHESTPSSPKNDKANPKKLEPPLTSRAPKRTKKINVEDKLVEFMETKSKSQQYDDEDMAFFISLLPTVKALDSSTKFQFRIQVMQVLQQLQGKAVTTMVPQQNYCTQVPYQSAIQSTSQGHLPFSQQSYNTQTTHYDGNATDQDFSRPSSAGSYLSNFSPL